MTTLHVTQIGTGAPRFVFLHGLLGRGRNWATIANALVDSSSSALLYDLPDHGESEWLDQFSYAQTADLVAQDLQRRCGQNPQLVLAGHSMGGKVAMVTALRSPSLFSGLAVIDIAPRSSAQVTGFGRYLDAMLSIDLDRLSRRSEAEAALSVAVPDPSVRAFLLTNLRQDPHWRWSANLAGLRQALPDIARWPHVDGQFTGPTFWIVGERSGYHQEQDLALLRRYFPRTKRRVIPGAGHWVHADNPDAVVAALAELSSLSPR